MSKNYFWKIVENRIGKKAADGLLKVLPYLADGTTLNLPGVDIKIIKPTKDKK